MAQVLVTEEDTHEQDLGRRFRTYAVADVQDDRNTTWTNGMLAHVLDELTRYGVVTIRLDDRYLVTYSLTSTPEHVRPTMRLV